MMVLGGALSAPPIFCFVGCLVAWGLWVYVVVGEAVWMVGGCVLVGEGLGVWVWRLCAWFVCVGLLPF